MVDGQHVNLFVSAKGAFGVKGHAVVRGTYEILSTHPSSEEATAELAHIEHQAFLETLGRDWCDEHHLVRSLCPVDH